LRKSEKAKDSGRPRQVGFVEVGKNLESRFGVDAPDLAENLGCALLCQRLGQVPGLRDEDSRFGHCRLESVGAIFSRVVACLGQLLGLGLGLAGKFGMGGGPRHDEGFTEGPGIASGETRYFDQPAIRIQDPAG
jgi:hypothetical protein